MAFFYSFTDSLKQKWLQFYASNRDWIKLHMEVDSVYTPDGGKRPSSYLILGVANALEPKLAQLMLPFSKLNADADTLIEVLDLHFDPDAALGEQTMQPALADAGNSEFSINENEDELNSVASLQDNFGELGNVPDIDSGDSNGETLVVEEAWGGQDFSEDRSQESGLDDIQGESLEDISLESEQNSSTESEEDAFGDISFDEFKDGDSTGFGDALTDVWGEQSAQKDHEIFSGEDMSDGSIDDSEIARLFPNG
ncbi:DUF5331 domain-containing protein [Rivularia sp. UHCC 0363]|uniref:DUF5331 domain-containing protein n=1 Tax=Rivularia sp. UHCC 0363 TaxID=3110244 RepID=UPI002B203A81|nr:DUF5331 domain-containing protein [Rivularia sp. UHCC 0363]MEA5597690.1 DUF5331 domain-containing protein [Rivularia sp. UHCC 0363]